IRRWRYNLIPAESKFKNLMLDHQDKYMMKAQDQGIFYSRCSRHMTGNKSFLTDYQEFDGGYVAFGGGPKGDLTFWLLALDYLIFEGVFAMVKTINDDVRIQALLDGKKVVVNEASIRRNLRLDDAKGTACLPSAAIFEDLARMKFIQVFMNHQLGDMSHHKGIFINPSLTPEKVGEIPNDAQDTSILTQHHPLNPRESTKHRGGKGRKQRVLSLEQTKTNQAAKSKKLKKRVKKIEGKKKKRTHGLKRLYKGRINEEDLFGVHDLSSDEVFVDVTTGENIKQDATVAEKDDELTLAQTLMKIKEAKPKEKGVTIQEPSKTPSPKPIVSSRQPSKPKDKDKAKMVEPERPLKRKEQIMMDEQNFRDLEAQMQADLEEEQRIENQKEEEANIAMIAEWDNTQTMMDADCELAIKLQEEEKGELSIEEKSKLFVELMNKRKNHFEKFKAKERRRKPPTKHKRESRCVLTLRIWLDLLTIS
nr:hypothetical protein [Tanacetum cinerariifolium]